MNDYDYNIANRELASWARASRKLSSDSFLRGAVVACLAIAFELNEDTQPPKDDVLTVDSFLVGRFDDKYLAAVERGCLLNYAAWLRYRSELTGLTQLGGEDTPERYLRIDALENFLRVK